MNTYNEITPTVEAKVLIANLPVAQKTMVLEKFIAFNPMPRNSGRIAKFTRWNPLPRASSPLGEGVPPTGTKITKTDISVALEQYGDVLELTDRIVNTHTDPVLKIMSTRCLEQAAESIEVMRFGVFKGGSNVTYGGEGTTRATVNGVITRAKTRLVIRNFARQKARQITKIIKASALIATEPISAAYVAICHPDLVPDVRAITGFIPAEYYGSSEKAMDNEFGKTEDIRWIKSELLEPWLSVATAASATYLAGGAVTAGGSNNDVYPILIFAQDAVAGVPLAGEDAIRLKVINPGQLDSGNRLGQVGSVGWITDQAAVILNDNWLARIEVLCSANLA